MRSPWRRTSRGRLTRRADVRLSSGREESNSHDPGSRPGGQPLTHTQMSLSFPHHGSNVNPRNQRPRCCRLHHAGMGWTTRLALAWQTFTASGLDSSPSSTVLGTGFEPVFAVSETAVLPVRRSESASARRESNSRRPLIKRALCHGATGGCCFVPRPGVEPGPSVLQTNARHHESFRGKGGIGVPPPCLPLRFSESTSGATTLVGQRGFEPRSLG